MKTAEEYRTQRVDSKVTIINNGPVTQHCLCPVVLRIPGGEVGLTPTEVKDLIKALVATL